jgi:hypothetical protein
MSQSNTQSGQLVLPAGEDLTDMEGRLVSITQINGSPVFTLTWPLNATHAFVLTDGDSAGQPVAAQPLSPERNYRVRLSGTCVAGDLLGLAAKNGQAGYVQSVGATPTTATIVGIAEESGVDDQLIKMRPSCFGYPGMNDISPTP